MTGRTFRCAVTSIAVAAALAACAANQPVNPPPTPAEAEFPDAAFMQQMIVHHAQALEMIALLDGRTTRDDLRLLGERMAVSQRDEIALMRRWLESRGLAVPAEAASHQHGDGHSAHMAGMLTPAEMQQLAAASGPDFDRLFLEYMIRHHEGALAMVAELLATRGGAQRADVFTIAAEVDADQRAEIARMHALLSAEQVAVPVSASAEPRPAGESMSAAGAPGSGDPRSALRRGVNDAGTAAHNLAIVAHRPRPAGFFRPDSLVDFDYANTDIAFRGNLLFLGSYHGFQTWDISDPANPRIRSTFICPGGQGDVSVHGSLLFMSVQETRGRIDCGTGGVSEAVSTERLRGIRIFDISNLDAPRQVAAVQTCRGSHTHTLVTDPRDPQAVYVYVSGTNAPRPQAELARCVSDTLGVDTSSAYYSIEVIRVPLAAPQEARVVSAPRIFADPATGAIAGLWRGGAHGPGTQRTSRTDRCHDITVYPEIGLGAGACAGNGILLDLRNVASPVRLHEVSDPNFAFWHSATFSNDGSKIIFTDEWGGGSAPRCRATDRPEWGANALFEVNANRLTHRGYFKLPAAQGGDENCVAHNGSLIPIPGRDVMVQAWYQGGISVFDFTDPRNPVEIAYFDRGPFDADSNTTAGYWSAYWYNGRIYGSEILRGLDVFRLVPGPNLSANEIMAAEQVVWEQFNPQLQTRFTFQPGFVVVRAYLDQLMRNPRTSYPWAASVTRAISGAERLEGTARRSAVLRLARRLDSEARTSPDPARVRAMAAALREMAQEREAN